MKRTADRLFGSDYNGRSSAPAAINSPSQRRPRRWAAMCASGSRIPCGPERFAQSNAEQVRTVRQIIEGLELSVASPDEAREILQLKGDDRVRFLTPSVRENELMLRIELLIDARAELGEGPLWDVAEQRLYWIDSLGAKVHSCDADGARSPHLGRARAHRLARLA